MFTKAQTALFDRFLAAGYELTKCEKMSYSRDAWIIAERKWKTKKHPNGNVFLDETLYGVVGPRGRVELTYSVFGYEDKVTEPWNLRSRLDTTRWKRITEELGGGDPAETEPTPLEAGDFPKGDPRNP
jgi:hypothetical protein